MLSTNQTTWCNHKSGEAGETVCPLVFPSNIEWRGKWEQKERHRTTSCQTIVWSNDDTDVDNNFEWDKVFDFPSEHDIWKINMVWTIQSNPIKRVRQWQRPSREDKPWKRKRMNIRCGNIRHNHQLLLFGRIITWWKHYLIIINEQSFMLGWWKEKLDRMGYE